MCYSGDPSSGAPTPTSSVRSAGSRKRASRSAVSVRSCSSFFFSFACLGNSSLMCWYKHVMHGCRAPFLYLRPRIAFLSRAEWVFPFHISLPQKHIRDNVSWPALTDISWIEMEKVCSAIRKKAAFEEAVKSLKYINIDTCIAHSYPARQLWPRAWNRRWHARNTGVRFRPYSPCPRVWLRAV